MDKQQVLSSLPSVDEVIKSEKGLELLGRYLRRFVVEGIREVIQRHRQAVLKGEMNLVSEELMIAEIETKVEALSEYSLRPVINATGIVIHTNLGRSLLSEEVMEHVKSIACSYSNLEYDLPKGRRGKRYSHIQRLLREITGAEEGLLVNNNAAAVFVSLNTLARGKEVVVSRGELVEIGGSFRVPEVMSNSGATLREVGTTNKTHDFDYEQAINENTALLMKVHQSNYRMVGFTESVSPADLVRIGRKHGLPVMVDLGSGCLIDLHPYGIHIEPTVQEVVKAGVDLVTFSGDKLFGGPQGGVIVGRADLIEKIGKNPLLRAVRIDKLTLAAFEATLMCYADESEVKNKVPSLRLLLQDPEEIRKRARSVAGRLRKLLGPDSKRGVSVTVVKDASLAGGGSLPELSFDTYAVSIKTRHIPVNEVEERLRMGRPPIIARIKDDALLLDLRTVRNHEIAPLVKRAAAVLLPGLEGT